MSDFLNKMIASKSYLNNVLNKLYNIFNSKEFNDYLEASGLHRMESVKKGYPNMDSQSVKTYEAFINTSSSQDCLVWDVDDGVDVLAIVDVYLPNNALKYIWKLADATLQWLMQFNVSSLTILGISKRIYTKASGDSANHITLSVHCLADKFIDSDEPTLVDES